MTLTPEQKAEGWIKWNGGECPIRDDRTIVEVLIEGWDRPRCSKAPSDWNWTHHGWGSDILAYRIIEAHGADAEPDRPTPFPASYDELVFDDAGWSQTIIVDGKRPEWLRDDDGLSSIIRTDGYFGYWNETWQWELAIRVRRREPKRETGECFLIVTARSPSLEFQGTIDLIDGKPDLSTIKIAEDAL